MQELMVKLCRSMTFIADNIFCTPAWSFTLSLMVLGIWHFAFEMFRKSYPDFWKQICWAQHFSERVSKKWLSYNFKSSHVWRGGCFKNINFVDQVPWDIFWDVRGVGQNFSLSDLGDIPTCTELYGPSRKRIHKVTGLRWKSQLFQEFLVSC